MIDQDQTTETYVSVTHTRRAIGYLGAMLAEGFYLNPDFEQPLLLEFWSEALHKTMDLNERSPVQLP
jgi:hypothetical protein